MVFKKFSRKRFLYVDCGYFFAALGACEQILGIRCMGYFIAVRFGFVDTLPRFQSWECVNKALQDKQEYYAEDEFDDANIAERAKDILDNLAEIFGSDEQED